MMRSFVVHVSELSPTSKSRWLIRQQIANDRTYAEMLEEQQQKECAQLISEANKRPPGRPKKSNHEVQSTVVSAGADVDAAKRPRMHWFTTPHIHDILFAYEQTGSGYKAVQWLIQHRPQLPSEQTWKFRDLADSTIDSWYDNGKLKDNYAQQLAFDWKRWHNGRNHAFAPYPELVMQLKKRLMLVSEHSQISIRHVKQQMKAMCLKHAPQLVSELKFSRAFISRFCNTELNWQWRRCTTALSKLPEDWCEQGKLMAERLAALVKYENVNPHLIINFDQTGLHLMPKSAFTYAVKKTKSVGCVGADDKRQITAVIGSTYAGDLLPLQLIFQGKVASKLEPLYRQGSINLRDYGFHLTCSANHWSTLETMKEYFARVIEPWRKQQIVKFNLPANSKVVVMLDCWSVHRGKDFRDFVEKQYEHCVLLFIPPCCTSKLQVADVALNYPFKVRMRQQFEDWTIGIVCDQLDNVEGSGSSILPPTASMKVLKPLLVQWAFNSWQKIAHSGKGSLLIQKGFHKCVTNFADPFNAAVQKEAVKKAVKSQLKVYDELHKGKPDEVDNDKDYDVTDSDSDADELDIMKQRIEGKRRSTRKRKQVAKSNLCLATDQLELPGDYSESE
jgi:DDE superfamily endonuclease